MKPISTKEAPKADRRLWEIHSEFAARYEAYIKELAETGYSLESICNSFPDTVFPLPYLTIQRVAFVRGNPTSTMRPGANIDSVRSASR